MKRAWQRFSWPVALMVTAALGCLAAAFDLERSPADEGVRQRTLQSTTLGESRAYRVHLPDNYDEHPTRRYPVIYAFLRADPSLFGRLVLRLGSRENDKMTQAFRSAIDLLRMHAPPGFLWRAVISEGRPIATVPSVRCPRPCLGRARSSRRLSASPASAPWRSTPREPSCSSGSRPA